MCESGTCQISELYQNTPCYCMFYNVSWIEPAFWHLGGFLSPSTWHLSSGSRSAFGQSCAFFLSSSHVFTDSILPVKNMFTSVPIFRYLFIARSAFTFEVHLKKKYPWKKPWEVLGCCMCDPETF